MSNYTPSLAQLVYMCSNVAASCIPAELMLIWSFECVFYVQKATRSQIFLSLHISYCHVSHADLLRTQPVAGIKDLSTKCHWEVTFCAVSCSDCHSKRRHACWYSWQNSGVTLNAPTWPLFEVCIISLCERLSQFQDDTLAADAPLNRRSSFPTPLLCRGRGSREGARGGRIGNVMQECAVQTEVAVWIPITDKFSNRTHTHNTDGFPRDHLFTVYEENSITQAP